MSESESSESDIEVEIREAAQAFREFQRPIEVWVDFVQVSREDPNYSPRECTQGK